VLHAYGSSRVADRLKKERDWIGLIDEDPGKARHPYLRRLSSLGRDDRHGLELLIDRERNNFVVMLCPRLEEWILTVAKECGIDVRRDFGLPDRGDELHRILSGRGRRAKRGAMGRYEELVEALVSASSGTMSQLRKALFTPERWRLGGSP